MDAFCIDVRSKLIVSCIWGRNLSYSCIGQSLSTVASAAMMWYFIAFTAGSAALTRWLCGSTNLIATLSALTYFWTALEHSLSIMCNFVAYVYKINAILVRPMATLCDATTIDTFKDIYEYLKVRNLAPKLHIIDNECSKAAQKYIKAGRVAIQQYDHQ